MKQESLYERLGGRVTLEKVHKDFYDYVYDDAELGHYFKHVDQKFIERVQSDFMGGKFGGPSAYQGLEVRDAHSYMFIKQEQLESRKKLLQKALMKNKVAPDLIEEWLKIDSAFWQQIEKKNFAECKKRFFTQEFIVPPSLARAAQGMKFPSIKPRVSS